MLFCHIERLTVSDLSLQESNLVSTSGNLLNRTLGLLRKNCQSTIAVDSTIAAERNALKDTVEKLVKSTYKVNLGLWFEEMGGMVGSSS